MFQQETTISQKKDFAMSFLSKVYFAFGLAIFLSATGAYVGLNYLASYLLASPFVIYGLFFVELIFIISSRAWSQKAPINYVLFGIFAFITGLTIVPLLAYVMTVAGGVDLVIKALAATALMFGACAIFGATTSFNLQGLRGFLMMGLIGMIVVSIIGIFIPWGNAFEMIFAGIGVLLFSGYTMYDVQRLKSYGENQYIDAALQLYLDIFNLFIFILRLILALNRN